MQDYLCVYFVRLKVFPSGEMLIAVMTRDNYWYKLRAVLGPVEESGCSIAVTSLCHYTTN